MRSLKILKYISSVLLMLGWLGAVYAQDKPSTDSTRVATLSDKEKKKAERKKYRVPLDMKPSAVKVGTDIIGLARTGTSTGFTHLEGQFDIDFHRYFAVLDVGHERNAIVGEEYNYTNRGNYVRGGVQINMMPYNVDKSFFFLGFRYAHASFSDEVAFTKSFDRWGEKQLTFSNNQLTARWYELNMGMKVRVVKNLFFGYTIRYKMGRKLRGVETLQPRNIPGYGRADKSSNSGFNYYILYNIPFRDKPVPVKNKRPPKKRSQPSQSVQPSQFLQRSF